MTSNLSAERCQRTSVSTVAASSSYHHGSYRPGSTTREVGSTAPVRGRSSPDCMVGCLRTVEVADLRLMVCAVKVADLRLMVRCARPPSPCFGCCGRRTGRPRPDASTSATNPRTRVVYAPRSSCRAPNPSPARRRARRGGREGTKHCTPLLSGQRSFRYWTNGRRTSRRAARGSVRDG